MAKSMKYENLGIDIDDVVVDYMAGFLGFYNGKYRTNYKKEQFNSSGLESILNINKQKVKELIKEFDHHPLFKNLQPIDGSVECISELSKRHNVSFITSRSKAIEKQTNDFLKKYFGKIPFKVYYSGEAYPNQGEKKSDICKKLGISMIFEDNPKFAIDCANNGITVILLNQFWNQEVDHYNIIRAFGWRNEVIPIMKYLEGN